MTYTLQIISFSKPEIINDIDAFGVITYQILDETGNIIKEPENKSVSIDKIDTIIDDLKQETLVLKQKAEAVQATKEKWEAVEPTKLTQDYLVE